LHRESADHLLLNEIGRVQIETASSIFFDPYTKNRKSGSFILIDPASNLTVAAGMIVKEISELDSELDVQQKSSNVVWEDRVVKRVTREEKNGHQAMYIGLPAFLVQVRQLLQRNWKKSYLMKVNRSIYLMVIIFAME